MKIRLQDRGVRMNLSDYRKKVFLSDDKSFVEVHIVNSKYRPLFNKNLDAYRTLKNTDTLPELIDVDVRNMVFRCSYEGEPARESYTGKQAEEVVAVLGKISKVNKRKHKLLLPVYLETAREKQYRACEIDKSLFLELQNTLNILIKTNVQVEYGCGILDPSASNFTFNNVNRAHLVDLDNFSNTIGFDYQLGWLEMDHLAVFGANLNSDIEYGSLQSELMRKLGRLSRIVVQVVDTIDGKTPEAKLNDLNDMLKTELKPLKMLIEKL